MCIDHWRMVPKANRDEVLTTSRAWRSAHRRRPFPQMVEITRAYLQARDAAIAAVGQKQQRRAAAASEGQVSGLF